MIVSNSLSTRVPPAEVDDESASIEDYNGCFMHVSCSASTNLKLWWITPGLPTSQNCHVSSHRIKKPLVQCSPRPRALVRIDPRDAEGAGSPYRWRRGREPLNGLAAEVYRGQKLLDAFFGGHEMQELQEDLQEGE